MSDPTSPPSPEPTDQLVNLPRFGRQTGPRTAPGDPLPPGATTTSTTEPPPNSWDRPGQEEAFWAGVEADQEEARHQESATTTGSSRASTSDWRDFAGITHMLVVLISVGVRFVRTRRRHLPEDVWVADDDDQAAIGDPIARIAARHSPLEGGDAGDVVDGLTAVVGVAGYAVKNLAAEETAGALPDLSAVDDAG